MKLLFAAAVALAVLHGSACTTPMVRSFDAAPENALACDTNLGGYRLPRRLLKMTVKASAAARGYEPELVLGSAVGDGGNPICLSYINSITSADNVAIERTDEGLLRKISTKADDKSKEIILKLAETAARGFVGARQGTLGGLPQSISLEFDPFEPGGISRVNRDLRAYGLCVFIDEYHVDASITPQQWCAAGAHRNGGGGTHFSKAAAITSIVPVQDRSAGFGILYRPNMPHTVVVMRETDPGRGPWRMAMRKVIEMPNVSPVLSLSVDRTFFSTRTTKVLFEDGVLTNVEIDKTSELLALSETLLGVANQIVAIPGQIVQFKIDRTNNRTQLIAAQNSLISTYISYLSTYAKLYPAQQDQGGGNASVADGDQRSGSARMGTFDKNRRDFLTECINSRRAEYECEDLWRSQQVPARQ